MELLSPTRGALSRRSETFRRGWYKFSRNPLSIVGLATLLLIAFLTAFAPYTTPHPEHAGVYINFAEASQPPSLRYPFGTDMFGRDIFSRIIFAYRFSLLMGVVVLSLAAPVGIIVGLVAGYLKGTWIEHVCMRTTDIFLAVPPLVLALAISAVLRPTLFNAMMAISLMWWPWYARLVYGVASSLRGEAFVQAAEIMGAGKLHILFREILPNCVSSIFTKLTFDMGFVILMGAMLSFVGLGAQPPTPDLGSMIAHGARMLPDHWWMCVFPSLALVMLVLGFNLVGDGLRDVFALEES